MHWPRPWSLERNGLSGFCFFLSSSCDPKVWPELRSRVNMEGHSFFVFFFFCRLGPQARWVSTLTLSYIPREKHSKKEQNVQRQEDK
jgi:hypothetical protein